MAGINFAISGSDKNVIKDCYDSAKAQQNRGTGGWVFKTGGFSGKLYGNKTMPVEKYDMTYGVLEHMESSVASCFVTKNVYAKTRVIDHGLMVDGYIVNRRELTDGIEDRDPFLMLEKKMMSAKGLEELEEVFSHYVRGVGVLEKEDRLIAIRDRTGFKTGWVGEDSEKNLQMFVQESYILESMYNMPSREMRPGEIMEFRFNGDSSGFVNESERLLFDPQEIVKNFHPSTEIFGKSVYRHRLDLGRSLAKMYGGMLDDGGLASKKKVVTSFPEGPRPAGFGFYREAVGKVEYDEIYFKDREASANDQQRRFGSKNKFPFTVNGDAIVKDGIYIAIDDSLMKGTNARRHGEIVKGFEGVPVYMTMQVPIVFPGQVGYYTVGETMFNHKYSGDIKSGKISTISQMNALVSKDLGYTIRFNSPDSMASSMFSEVGGKHGKENLAMPDQVRAMSLN